MFAVQSTPGSWTITQQSYVLEVNDPPMSGTFTQYVAALPEWESELLRHTEMFEDPFTVAMALEHGVRAVSDGSDWNQEQGAFGWTMSTDRGERCAQGMGPARSSAPNAYRSESYGLLSLLCFLRRLAEFTGKHDQWYGVVATDSQSLIDTVLQRNIKQEHSGVDSTFIGGAQRQIKTHPLDPTLPDWDVIRGIQVLLQQMPELKLKHVKGHQDRDIPYRHLSLLAQLNVDADAQASQYQRDLGSYRPDVLLTEWAGVHLEFPSGTVTAHYEAALRYQATAPALQAHMQERHSWSPQTMAAINWKAHGSALRRHLKKRTFLVKLVHGILPTNLHLHRSDQRRNRCPSCQSVAESWQHIPCCPSDAHTSWRNSFLKTMEVTCTRLGTMPHLQVLLLRAIREWLHPHSETVFTVQFRGGDSPALRRVIFQQNAIGWEHILLGRFSSEWSRLQDEYYARRAQSTETKRQTGQRWQIAIISSIWKQWFLIWAIRIKPYTERTHDCRHKQSEEKLSDSCPTCTIFDLKWSLAFDNCCTEISPSIYLKQWHTTKTGYRFMVR
ncbi:hypothetical protein MHU86_5274 [Fragilaria crotonensis]|nr:hypothetical protein MHU86_5274 [Fragilaria crotonensis]